MFTLRQCNCYILTGVCWQHPSTGKKERTKCYFLHNITIYYADSSTLVVNTEFLLPLSRRGYVFDGVCLLVRLFATSTQMLTPEERTEVGAIVFHFTQIHLPWWMFLVALVCLFVCLSVDNISQKVMNRLGWNFIKESWSVQWRTD